MRDRLAIPLSYNPTRQATWRVVGALTLISAAAVLGYITYRFLLFRTTATSWPAEATSAVRFIKTPHTTQLLQEHFGAQSMIEGAPWTIGESLEWTKREYILFFSDEGIVGLALDGQLPIPQETLQELHLSTVKNGRKTVIYRNSEQEPTSARRILSPQLMLPWYQGMYYIKQEDDFQAVPLSLQKTGIRMPLKSSAMPTDTPSLATEDTQILARVHISPEIAASYLPDAVALTFPGMEQLLPELRAQGFNLVLGKDPEGISFILSTSTPNLSLETMGAIAREGLQIRNLSTTALTLPNFSVAQEIRGDENIEITTTTDNGINVVTAKNGGNAIFRLTQSPEKLILSNRPPVISQEINENSQCLRSALWYVRPQELAAHLPITALSRASSPLSFTLHATEIAWDRNTLKMCW